MSPAAASTDRSGTVHARNRLKLARVVLDAGFPNDAVRAAYDALAAAVGGLASGDAPKGHAALVAAMYRDLVPSGRISPLVPGVLARLHDLSTLDALGLDAGVTLAHEAVAEAESWVGRIAG